MKQFIAEWLDDQQHNLSLILPGTFHERHDKHRYNHGSLFNKYGKTILEHRKLKKFGDHNEYESIDTGDKIELLDTPIGLVAIPICLDFCEEADPLKSLWETIGPEWFLVPAMGKKSSISAHVKRAESLHRLCGAVSVLANQDPDGTIAGESFICANGRHDKVKENNPVISITIKDLLPKRSS